MYNFSEIHNVAYLAYQQACANTPHPYPYPYPYPCPYPFPYP